MSSHNRSGFLARMLATMVAGMVFLAASPWVPSAHANPVTPCSDDEVTVMIEGYPLACSPAGGSGWQTLINAGFTVEGTQKFPEFICRINHFPTADVDKCLTASPAHAYWTYWHAPLGGDSWEYSNLGALPYHPQPGTVEAWTWGPGVEPGPIPVSRTQTEEPSDSDSAADDTENGSGLIIPTFPTLPAIPATTPQSTQNNTTAAPEPEENPDNPDEVLVFLDAEGNRISRQEYEDLVAAASRAAAAPTQQRTAPQVDAPSASQQTAAPQPTPSTTAAPDPKSTRVMAAPAVDDAGQPGVSPDNQLYTEAAAVQSPAGMSDAWMLAVTVAFTVLLGGAATATWVTRRSEING